jgi:hypothetical protein
MVAPQGARDVLIANSSDSHRNLMMGSRKDCLEVFLRSEALQGALLPSRSFHPLVLIWSD